MVDFGTIILTTLLAMGILALILPLIIGYIVYRAFRNLPRNQQNAIIFLLFIIGIALVISLIGIEVGVIFILSSIVATLLRTFRGSEHD
jgi:Kef-type K+ transport system membrane component KefB